MKKRVFAIILAAVFVIGSMSSCGKENKEDQGAQSAAAVTEASEAEVSQASSSAETAKEETAAVSESKTEEVPAGETSKASEASSVETQTESSQAAQAEEETEEVSLVSETAETQVESATEEQTEDITEVKLQEGLTALSAPFTLTGGLKPLEDVPEPQDLSEEEQDQMDRAMRAYTPSASSLLKNKAKTFYYYSRMTKDQQAMYDAMMMVCEDPTNMDNIAKAVISKDPRSYGFSDDFYIAYYGLLYDHAELFWLYNFIATDIGVFAPYNNNAPAGKYEIYFALDRPYANYEKEMKAFNSAVDKFLSNIDRTKPASEIVKQIHNRLVNTVTYNTPVSMDNTEWGFCNYAHTAYGALVADSDGNKNYAVCDGYSQAFVYLLQQCGINAAVIVGIAGQDKSSAGGHAWSVVEIDGDWYEVDSTWDDPGSLGDSIEQIKNRDPFSYAYYREAFDDKSYYSKLNYQLYNVTTKVISSFVPDDYYTYYTKDGKYSISFVDKSVHIRASDNTWGYEDYGDLMALAPTANGTRYVMR